MGRQQLPPQIKKITVTDRKTGKPVIRYQLRVDVGGEKRSQINRRFSTEAEARAELVEIQSAVAAGTYVRDSDLTVRHAVDDWLASKHGLRPSTLRGHRVSLAVVSEQYGDMPVQRLTKRDVDNLVTSLRAGKIEGRKKWSARTCNYMVYLLTTVLEDLVRQGKVKTNVARHVDRVASDQPEMKTLPADDMHRILDHECRDRHLWTLALYGLRRGEIAGLRWSNVDFVGKKISIIEERVVVDKEIIIGPPKSKRSIRELPMPDDVVTVLKAARKRQLGERLAMGEDYGPGEYVASDEAGRPYNPNLLTFRWGKLLKDLGIDKVRLHDARHTCATHMHKQGVPIAVIAAWLGHASAAFTVATYTHADDDSMKVAAQSFGRDVSSCVTETGSDGG